MSDDLLPEDPDERRMFDDLVERLGCHPLEVVYNALRLSSVTAPSQGSYGKMMAVYANEVDRVIAELRKTLPSSDDTQIGSLATERAALEASRVALGQMLDDMEESGRSVCEEAKRMGKEALVLAEEALSTKSSTGWFPIETAPQTSRDGLRIDVWQEPIPEKQAGFVNPATAGRRLERAWLVEREDFVGYRNDDSYNGRTLNWRTTHWRPIPGPP